jgi:RNA polymerase sigma factor (sigma-70 family)
LCEPPLRSLRVTGTIENVSVHPAAAAASAAARRERDATVGELYAAYHRRLVGYLRATIPDADAEAAVQETFCRALVHDEDLSELDNPWAWLVVVARNLARNQLRDSHIGELVGLAVPESALGTVVGPEEHACVADDVRRLGAAIAMLTAVQRRMLSMLVVDGLSSAEAGRRLGLREDAARQHLCRLRRRLVAAYEAGSKTLAAFPLFGLRVLKRWWRRLGGGGAASSGLTSGALTVGALVGTLGVVAGIVGVTLCQPRPHSVPAALSLDASTSQRAPSLARPGGTTAHAVRQYRARTDPTSAKTGRTSAAASAGGFSAWGSVSHTPTKSGNTAKADLSVPTPMGPLDVPVTVDQYESALWVACPYAPSECDSQP